MLLGMGVWLVYGATIFVNVLGAHSAQLNISYFCFGMGAGLIVTSCIGSSGAWKEKSCFLTLVRFCLLIVTFTSLFIFLLISVSSSFIIYSDISF